MTTVLSAELGKPITYVNLPIVRWRQNLVKQVGLPESLATHLAAVSRSLPDWHTPW